MCLVSIITPTYNSGNYLTETIESVLKQTCIDWELLIVDDCSVDNSKEIAKRYSLDDCRIKTIQLKQNSGAAIARNRAIEIARGRFIAFLDSDDMWLPHKLETQIKFMQENDVALCYSAYEKLYEDGSSAGTINVPDKVSYKDLLKVCSIGCLTAIYDNEKVGKVYMPLIRKRQDLGLWLRILKQVPYAYGINEVLAQYQLRDDSISANKKVAAQYTWRLYRDIEKLSYLQSIYYFSHYAVNGVLRTKFPKIYNLLK